MKLLWLPFLPLAATAWEGSRHFHLLRHLQARHEFHLIAWDRWGRRSGAVPDDLSGRPNVHIHPVSIAPNIWKYWRQGYPRDCDLVLNRVLLGKTIALLNREFRPDAIVLSVTHYATGLPRLPTGVPVILDHVDECPTWVGEKYFRIADGISAVSNALYQSAAAVHPCVELIPNGVELGGYSSGHRESAKAALGLTGRVVVSLIGLTCSSRLYFLEAYADFAREVPEAVLLLVGDSQLAGAMKERIGHLGVDIRMTGHLSFDQVATYFNATDIGLYPGDDVPYFRQAYPLKIMEYTASGAQVVISPVDAFRSGWANVWTSQPDRDGFRNTMLEAWRNPRPAKDVSGMGWQDAAGRFEGLLEQVVARKEKRAS